MRRPGTPRLWTALAGALILALGVSPSLAAAQRQHHRKPTPRFRLHQHTQLTTSVQTTRESCLGARRSRVVRRTGRRLARLERARRRAHSRAERRRLSRRYRRVRHRHKARLRHLRERAALRCEATQSKQPQYAASPASIYWGAWIGDQLTGEQAPWDMSAVSKFEQMADKKLSIVHFGAPFANCYRSCYFYDFPTNPMQDIRDHGSIPFLSWSSQSIPTQTSEPDYQLSDVAGGAYDSFIRKFATDAAKWGHPFFLRFNWEMNGYWFPWGVGANGNTTADFIAAWRHVHDIFTSVGATNASWVWCPNVDPGRSMADIASLYPGDGYVDWTCLDGYNWGTGAGDHEWHSFDQLYRKTYDRVVGTIAPNKPMIIGETGSSEAGGSKAAWISDMLAKIPSEYPDIRGLLYFERYDDGMNWPIESSASATAAFAAGVQNPAYAANSFSSLGAGPIPPPSS